MQNNLFENRFLKLNHYLFLLPIVFVALFAADGDLDTTFNSIGAGPTQAGTVFTAIGTSSAISSIAVQSDGKIVAGGLGFINENRFALARYNIDGSLDSSFGSGGIVTTMVAGSSNSKIFSIAIQADGKIVAAGYTHTGILLVFALARYNIDGSLDSSFGSGGIVTTGIPSSTNSIIRSILLQSDGQIVAGGFSRMSGVDKFTLARYSTDGSLDSSFGSGGIVVTEIPESEDSEISSIALQSDGKIVAGGIMTTINTDYRFALARYNTDGSLDSSFGSGGIIVTAVLNSDSFINSVEIQPNGKIVVGGFATVGGSDRFTLARYNTNGLLDNSFGSGGIVATVISGSANSGIYSIGLQSDGKIVASGTSIISGKSKFTLARYNKHGLLDISFGTSGIVTTVIDSSTFSRINSIFIQSNSIIAGGYQNSGGSKFALARYIAS